MAVIFSTNFFFLKRGDCFFRVFKKISRSLQDFGAWRNSIYRDLALLLSHFLSFQKKRTKFNKSYAQRLALKEVIPLPFSKRKDNFLKRLSRSL
jgi:hypothetical protein